MREDGSKIYAALGRVKLKLDKQVCKKLIKNKTPEKIAENWKKKLVRLYRSANWQKSLYLNMIVRRYMRNIVCHFTILTNLECEDS